MSSTRVKSEFLIWLLLLCGTMAAAPQNASPPVATKAQKVSSNSQSSTVVAPDPALLFQHGQEALNLGRLDEAERNFRQVLALNPQLGGVYANLGVVYMRRRQWTKALEMLHQAEHLLPQVAGIRLNIGLAYYRQSEFLKAIPLFESVVRDQPDAAQPRHLLGICYFFTQRWADAARTVEPLWSQTSTQLDYLYVLMIAANRAGQKELDERAFAQLVKVGGDLAEFHLFMGKSHLNLEQYDMALTEFQAAARARPNLTFVHFNLGLTYLKKQDYEHARDEFLRDAAIEPDLALNYDELGEVYSLMQQDHDAEKNYREALRREPRLVNSYFGLAKIYQRAEKYQQSLAAIDSAAKLDPGRPDIHYLRRQVLVHLGRKEAGKKELETAVHIDNQHRAQREKQIEHGAIPSPEIMHDQQ